MTLPDGQVDRPCGTGTERELGRLVALPDGGPEQFEQSRLVHDVRTAGERCRERPVVLVGYSLGAALALPAMQVGLRVKAAVIAGATPSVLRWTDEDERR